MVRSASSGLNVAAGFDDDEIEVRKPGCQISDRGEINRCILADRRVRAAARLDADDALRSEGARAREKLRILLRVDVIGDDREGVTVAQRLAQGVGQRCLAGADRPADAHPQGPMR